jgi:hypothetical protein
MILEVDPVIGINGDGRLEVFWRGTDFSLKHCWQLNAAPDAGWSGVDSLAGKHTSNIALAANQDARLEVFARSDDAQIWHRWQLWPSSGFTSTWACIGDAAPGGVPSFPRLAHSNPAVTRDGHGQLNVFIRNGRNAIIRNTQLGPNGAFNVSAWTDMGGVFVGDPVAGTWSDGHVEVFSRGLDNNIWHAWESGGVWQSWQPLQAGGAQFAADPTLVLSRTGMIEVYTRGFDSAIYRNCLEGGAWVGWRSLGGFWLGEVGAGRNLDGGVSLFVRGTNNAVWHNRQSPTSSWSGWQSLGGITTSRVSVQADRTGRLAIVYRGSDNQLHFRIQNDPNGIFLPEVSIGDVSL